KHFGTSKRGTSSLVSVSIRICGICRPVRRLPIVVASSNAATNLGSQFPIPTIEEVFMSNKAARNLFIFGSLFFFAIFLALTFDTMGKLDARAPEITEQVDAGKHAWQKYDCIGCHTIFGNGSYFAPDLTKTTDKKPKEYLKKFLM